MYSEKTAVLPKSELTSLKRITLIVAAVVIFAVLVVSTYLHKTLEQKAVRDWQEQNLPLAKALAGRIDQEMGKARAALRLLSVLPTFRGALNTGAIEPAIGGVPESAEAEKRRILDRFLTEYPDFSVLFLLAPNGDHYLTQPFWVQRTITKYNMRDRDYFQETVRTGDTVISDSFLGADNRLMVTINTPIQEDGGGIIAYLGGVFHLERLSRVIQRFTTSVFDEMFLLDGHGDLLGHSDPRWLEPERREAFQQRSEVRDLQAAIASDNSGEAGYQAFSDPATAAAYHSFRVPLASGWQMVVLRDRDSLLASIQSRSRVITVTAALILIGIGVIGLMIVNGVGRRWERAETALKVAKRQLEHEAEVRNRELIASHEHIELLLASTGAGIFGIDPQGRCTFCNMAGVQMLGYSSDRDLLGKPLFEIIRHCRADGTAYENDNSPILTMLHGGERVHAEHEIFHTAGGRSMPVEYRAYPMRRQDEVVGVVVTFNDISNRIKARQAQAESDARFRSLFAQSSDAIFLLDPQTGRYLDANQAAEKLTGRSVDELKTLTSVDISPAGALERCNQARKLETTGDMGEVVYIRPDGTERTALLSVVPLTDGLVFGIAHDITDQLAAKRTLKQNEAHLRALSEAAFEAIFIAESGVCLGQNRAAEKLFGYTLEEAVGRSHLEWIAPESRALVKRHMLSGYTEPYEVLALRKDGSTFPAEIRGRTMPYQDRMVRVTALRDITEHKRTEETIRTLSHAMEQSPVSVVITNLDGHIEYANRGFERSSGYSAEEILGRHTRMFGSGNTEAAVYRELWSTISNGKSWQGEFQNRRKDGSLFWEYAHISPILDGQGRIRHYLAVKEDVTLRKVQEEKILHQAHYDSLTGLPNRFLALDRLSQIIRAAQRENHQSAVLFLDLDDFKKVNDTLGHEVGDQVIEEAARRVRWAIRDEDTVGRLGGDEFIVLLDHLHERGDAQRVAEKILAAFRTVFRLGEREILLTASIGISIYPDDGDTAKILLRNADTAMYYSKSVGRNAFNFYTDAMNQDVSRRLELEEQLHTALENDEFHLLFQPIVNIHTQGIVGAEALLRWNSPKLGQVPPTEFIEIAERTGRIVPIGEYVLRAAIQQVGHWHDYNGQTFRVAINVSPVQFKDGDFLNRVGALLEEYRLPGRFLEIEVTENVLLSEKINSVEILNGLRDLGISLSMDDFGTGYSSLSYLRHYHFDTLKIDRSFVRDITTDPDDRELVVATISMAHSLGLKVIAEGVETAEQLAILQAEKCDFAQGYYFSKPITAQALERFFMK